MSKDLLSIISPSNAASTSENISSTPCGICRRQFSRYTCPKCNLLYCSLTCFRNASHSECSESFYRKELETDIQSAPSKTTEERLKTMELLKRFEEEAQNDELDMLDGDDSDNSADEDNLEARIAELNLDKASYDDLWSALTPAERDKFLKALNDPTSELAQQLLASEDLEKQIVEPWWERPPDDVEVSDSTLPAGLRRTRRYGEKPGLIDCPPAVVKASEITGTGGPSLLYNICAVIIAYAYVTRYLSSSPLSSISPEDSEYDEALRLFSRLVPFLADRKSKMVLPSLSGLITDLWSRFESDTMTPAFFSLIMQDAATLLRPLPVVPIASNTHIERKHEFADHPSANAFHALSDISLLFQKAPSRSARTHPVSPVVAKIQFYAARVMSTPTYTLKALADEITVRAKLLEREGNLNNSVPTTNMDEGRTSKAKIKDGHPRVEELT